MKSNDRPPFHVGNIATSKRLQRALAVIQKAGSLTGWEWCQQADIMNPGGLASELRQNGHWIQAIYLGMNQNGRKVWKYFYRGKREKIHVETKPETIT